MFLKKSKIWLYLDQYFFLQLIKAETQFKMIQLTKGKRSTQPTPATCVHHLSWPHRPQLWSHRVSNRPRVLDMCTRRCCFLNVCLIPVLLLSCSPLRSWQINDGAGEACWCIVLYAGHVIMDRLSSIWRPGWRPHDSVSDLTCLLCFMNTSLVNYMAVLSALLHPSSLPLLTLRAPVRPH